MAEGSGCAHGTEGEFTFPKTVGMVSLVELFGEISPDQNPVIARLWYSSLLLYIYAIYLFFRVKYWV